MKPPQDAAGIAPVALPEMNFNEASEVSAFISASYYSQFQSEVAKCHLDRSIRFGLTCNVAAPDDALEGGGVVLD